MKKDTIYTWSWADWSLIQKLETENKSLKAEIEALREELEKERQKNEITM